MTEEQRITPLNESRWESFLYPADEWLINYASLPVLLTSVALFSIGHAAELYLKSAVAKLAGDHRCAVARGHRLDLLLADCASFLPDCQLRPSVLKQMPINGDPFTVLSQEDFEHYRRHPELYLVAAHLPDWKYWGAPRKKPGPMAFGFVYPNDYWIDFFSTIRRFLGYPMQGRVDLIAWKLADGELPPRAVAFLSQLYRS